jgi:hypothetical protein
MDIGSIVGEVLARPMAGPEVATDAELVLRPGTAPAGESPDAEHDEIPAIDVPRG